MHRRSFLTATGPDRAPSPAAVCLRVPCRRAPSRRARALRIRTALAIAALTAALLPVESGAVMFKCRAPGGGVEYSDRPCSGDPKARPFVPKPLNTVSSESLTGRPAEPPPEKDARPDWLKPLNPIEDCRKKGGEFDKEFRACKLPLKDPK